MRFVSQISRPLLQYIGEMKLTVNLGTRQNRPTSASVASTLDEVENEVILNEDKEITEDDPDYDKITLTMVGGDDKEKFETFRQYHVKKDKLIIPKASQEQDIKGTDKVEQPAKVCCVKDDDGSAAADLVAESDGRAVLMRMVVSTEEDGVWIGLMAVGDEDESWHSQATGFWRSWARTPLEDVYDGGGTAAADKRTEEQKVQDKEEQDREAENRGVKNKRTIRGEALL
ncbi:hypothetical protein PPACK8108_LOCUS8797 [Phakopsora pachyrhizi]|uniref:Uncharacterized protein n=1 Tax=Phakopsora pachyrhizi TaxID=170000 RepID=A0AAV0AVB4_PHAPC|nr:hypothetical protein PPACK8108_LOCUS8797 [Phakopsora pachyrhizi]